MRKRGVIFTDNPCLVASSGKGKNNVDIKGVQTEENFEFDRVRSLILYANVTFRYKLIRRGSERSLEFECNRPCEHDHKDSLSLLEREPHQVYSHLDPQLAI